MVRQRRSPREILQRSYTNTDAYAVNYRTCAYAYRTDTLPNVIRRLLPDSYSYCNSNGISRLVVSRLGPRR
jgi:hypothetical protein